MSLCSPMHLIGFSRCFFIDHELQRDRKRYREDDVEGVRARSQRSSRSYREWEETPSRVRDEPATPKFSSKGSVMSMNARKQLLIYSLI